MKIKITAREANEKGIWEEFCEITGYAYYSMKEGLDPETEVELTEKQAKELNLI